MVKCYNIIKLNLFIFGMSDTRKCSCSKRNLPTNSHMPADTLIDEADDGDYIDNPGAPTGSPAEYHGQTQTGVDGVLYISVPDDYGVYEWKNESLYQFVKHPEVFLARTGYASMQQVYDTLKQSTHDSDNINHIKKRA